MLQESVSSRLWSIHFLYNIKITEKTSTIKKKLKKEKIIVHDYNKYLCYAIYKICHPCSRVEGRLFYGHKIVLVSESARLRAMLAPPRSSNEALPPPNTAPPLVQINDIRYHIFEVCFLSF